MYTISEDQREKNMIDSEKKTTDADITEALNLGYNPKGEPLTQKSIINLFRKDHPKLHNVPKENLNKPYVVVTYEGEELYKSFMELMLGTEYYSGAEEILDEGADLPDPWRPIDTFSSEKNYLKYLAKNGHDLFIEYHKIESPEEQLLLITAIHTIQQQLPEGSVSDNLAQWVYSKRKKKAS